VVIENIEIFLPGHDGDDADTDNQERESSKRRKDY
jgi:hypothetical protein